jgi:hypothetical protein
MSEPIGGRITAVVGTQTITPGEQAPKIITLDDTAAACVVSMPAATGTGHVYKFVCVADLTTNGAVITADDLDGSVTLTADAGDTVVGFEATGTHNTITLDGADTGGNIGDTFTLTDIGTDTWAIEGNLVGSGTEASPFSAV